MIQDDKKFALDFGSGSIYQGFKSLPGDVITCLENNGFTTMARTSDSVMFFGAKTVNNLPMLLEVHHPLGSDSQGIKVIYKVPVLPLKPMLEDALNHIFGQRS